MLVYVVIISIWELVCCYFILCRKIYYKFLKENFFCKVSDNNVWVFLIKKFLFYFNIIEI